MCPRTDVSLSLSLSPPSGKFSKKKPKKPNRSNSVANDVCDRTALCSAPSSGTATPKQRSGQTLNRPVSASRGNSGREQLTRTHNRNPRALTRRRVLVVDRTRFVRLSAPVACRRSPQQSRPLPGGTRVVNQRFSTRATLVRVIKKKYIYRNYRVSFYKYYIRNL